MQQLSKTKSMIYKFAVYHFYHSAFLGFMEPSKKGDPDSSRGY